MTKHSKIIIKSCENNQLFNKNFFETFFSQRSNVRTENFFCGFPKIKSKFRMSTSRIPIISPIVFDLNPHFSPHLHSEIPTPCTDFSFSLVYPNALLGKHIQVKEIYLCINLETEMKCISGYVYWLLVRLWTRGGGANMCKICVL